MKIFALAVLAASAGVASATVSFNGGTYVQNFDSLTSTNTNGQAWTNDTTLVGWSLFKQPAPGTAITSYGGDNGAFNGGQFYSYGTTNTTDRALGSLGSGGAYFGSPGSGAVAGWFAVALTNTSSNAFSNFMVSFDGEQWRNGGNTSAQTMVLEYGFGATFQTVATWTAPGGAYNFTSPIVGSTAAALDGNAAANRSAGLGGTIVANWGVGQTLWVRWIELNDVGNDHGLAIDNFSLAIPTPGSVALLGLGGLVAGRRRR